MQNSFLFYKLSFVALAVLVLTGCTKENGIDNDTVIKKPYGLYIGTRQGALLNTNDGEVYKTVFHPDGYPQRAVLYSGPNIVMIKANVHTSQDNGLNFNPAYFFAHPFPEWQQMILNVPSHSRIYISSIDPSSKGIAYSEDNGKKWLVDGNWDVSVDGEDITSFTQLKNGVVFAHSFNEDSLYRRDDKTAPWKHVKPVITPLPGGINYISHIENTLLAADRTGMNGVHFSNDNGLNWSKYSGLPTREILSISAPFDQTLLVGTDSMGVYKLNGTNFQPSNKGLETNTSVFAIIGKEDIFKNNAVRRYIYIATDKGLYRSNDMGENWHLVNPGSYRALY